MELNNSGSGYGSGDGSGSGYGSIELQIPESDCWIAYHYIKQSKNGFVTRNEKQIMIGQTLNEQNIVMCECGLHAGLSPVEAGIYKPDNSVLTKVEIWGRVILDKDKLVATNRRIIEVL